MIHIKNLTVKNFMSVDSIVTSHLTQLDSPQYDKTLMLDIYQNL